MHGKDAAGNEFSMLADAEMPRLYPHHVIEHELQVEPPLHTHLGRAKGQEQAAPASPSPDPLGTRCCTLERSIVACLCLPGDSAEAIPTSPKCTAPWDCSHQEGTKKQGESTTERRNTTAKQQRQHRKLLSFSQSQTQPGFLRTASFSGITCDILQGDAESREPLWLGTSPFDDSTSFQGGHLQRFTGELGTGLGTRRRESQVITAR